MKKYRVMYVHQDTGQLIDCDRYEENDPWIDFFDFMGKMVIRIRAEAVLSIEQVGGIKE